MRIDVVSIFAEYLAPLELSLIGAARQRGRLDIRVHDLRQWTHDKHRTVDSAPYGGGAGMVMRPEPWGEALDWLRTSGQPDTVPHLIVPSPTGQVFTQERAAELATEPWLAFACGRYEGIDERVVTEAATVIPVSLVSLGDYVLNGGEVAALAIIEAVARLVPGVIGNEESLTEESHTGGLLEYPVYTKPATWRGHDVPDVLRSGDHGAIRQWRQEQRHFRTASRRPDLVPAAGALQLSGVLADRQDVYITPAVSSDAGEIFTVARACWMSEAREQESFVIPALTEDFDDVVEWMRHWRTWVARLDNRIIGSVRACRAGRNWDIGRLMVAPDVQGCGLGKALMEFAELAAPPEVSGYTVFTGAKSVNNVRRYQRAGYRITRTSDYMGLATVEMLKPRRPPTAAELSASSSASIGPR